MVLLLHRDDRYAYFFGGKHCPWRWCSSWYSHRYRDCHAAPSHTHRREHRGGPLIRSLGGYEEAKWGYEALLADRNQEAARWLGDAVVYQPRLPVYWFNLGIAYQRLGNRTAAQAAYERAHQLEPNKAEYSAASQALN
ncbi:MAG: hypothetical protein DMG96_22580 [Acidobacteria bacterium]|nr:MAG: hypothetical protein DMG96_22580 [Acidobacteriota bacterium]